MKKNIIQAITEKEMDRKDFLKYSGLALAAVVGLKTVISLISQPDDKKNISDSGKQSGHGFGGGKYGA